MNRTTRRNFLRTLGLSAGAWPFVAGLHSLRAETPVDRGRKRLVILFTPNGTLPGAFWPDRFAGDQPLQVKSMLSPLEPFRDQMLMLKGVANKIGGDGDNHMRGMSCLLTASELNPGNIQGGSHTPAGWASSISIDQAIGNHLQSLPHTRTRFGSLEFGVAVPNRADPWTRMCYAGNNRPLAPLSDPEVMFNKLYGGIQDRESLASILDPLAEELRRVATQLSPEDRELLDQHLTLVRDMEVELADVGRETDLAHPEPEIDPEIELINDNTPRISRMQLDLMVNALANDMTRVASIQFMRSVGQARMRWLDIEEGHHSLSHEPDKNQDATDKLHRVNHWFAGELAYLARRLADIPEAGGNMLDHTQIVWVNELGKGNSHTLADLPFLLLGGGAGFRTGLALDFGGTPHNRLWMSLAQAFGVEAAAFGKESLCQDGALDLG